MKLAKRFSDVTVRDDLEFTDGSHLAEDAVLVEDPISGNYSTITRLTYEVLAAVDDASSEDEARASLRENFEYELDATELYETLEQAYKLGLLDLWSCSAPIELRGRSSERLRQYIETLCLTAPTGCDALVEQSAALIHDVDLGNATVVAKRLRRLYLNGESTALLIYRRLLFEARRRKPIEISFMKSRVDLFDPTQLLKTLEIGLGWLHGPVAFIALPFLFYQASFYPSSAHNVLFDPYSKESIAFWIPKNSALVPLIAWSSIFLHEVLGHALALHRFGGKVPRIGLISFYFIMLGGFADASSSYKLTNRWKRCWVGLAGVYINLVMAALSLVVLQYVAFDSFPYRIAIIGVVTNTGSILFNMMPWIKFDGYYVLQDVLGVTNLSSRAQRISASFVKYLFIAKPFPKKMLRDKKMLVLGVSFWVGKWGFILFLVMMWMTIIVPRLTATFGLLGILLFAFFLFRRIVLPLILRRRKRKDNGKKKIPLKKLAMRWVRSWRPAATMLLLILFSVVPFHFTAQRPAVLEARRYEIKAPLHGALTMHAKNGQRLNSAQAIASIEHPERTHKAEEASHRLAMQEAKTRMVEKGLGSLDRAVMKSELESATSKTFLVSQRMLSAHQASGMIGRKAMRATEEEYSKAQDDQINVERDQTEKESIFREESRRRERAALRHAKVRLDRANNLLSRERIVAPHAGIFVENPVVVRSTWIRRNEILGLLIDDETLSVRTLLEPEFPISRIDPTRIVEFRLRSGKKGKCEISEVRTTPDGVHALECDAEKDIHHLVGATGEVAVPLREETLARALFRNLFAPFRQFLDDVGRS